MSSPAPYRSALGQCPLCSFEIAIARGAQRQPQAGDFISCPQCLAPLKVSAIGLSILTEAEREQFLKVAQRVAHQYNPVRTRHATRCTAQAAAHLNPRCEHEQGHSGSHGAWSVGSAERLSW